MFEQDIISHYLDYCFGRALGLLILQTFLYFCFVLSYSLVSVFSQNDLILIGCFLLNFIFLIYELVTLVILKPKRYFQSPLNMIDVTLHWFVMFHIINELVIQTKAD